MFEGNWLKKGFSRIILIDVRNVSQVFPKVAGVQLIMALVQMVIHNGV